MTNKSALAYHSRQKREDNIVTEPSASNETPRTCFKLLGLKGRRYHIISRAALRATFTLWLARNNKTFCGWELVTRPYIASVEENQEDIPTAHPTQRLGSYTDGDGIPDDMDICPLIPNDDQTDTNGDGEGDACDDDIDGDGVPNTDDTCPFTPTLNQDDTDGDGIADACDDDIDGDGIPNDCDNCVKMANVDQTDIDNDGLGDVCDTSPPDCGAAGCNGGVCVADGLCVCFEGFAGNLCEINDIDGDGIPDDMDNCPLIPNDDQTDTNGDGEGDACDDDIDGDGVPNTDDTCPFTPTLNQDDTDGDGIADACDDDIDGDGIPNDCDNCVKMANVDQTDIDNDGLGDVCDSSPPGKIFLLYKINNYVAK
ncbi:uncharacterized protein [Amphiura filiformis]|uniref:uncharacterized protein n=1 Tax=Amphiura filiformis TaxID=82378 RepID=UPI003B20E68A